MENINLTSKYNFIMSELAFQKPHTSTPLKITSPEMVKSDDSTCQKSTRFLGNRAVSILQKWFNINKEYPYPDDATTDKLAKEANISCKQVKKWFANKRVRSQMCCKPIHRNIHKKKSSQKSQQQQSTTISQESTYNPTIQLTSPVSTVGPTMAHPFYRHLAMNPALLMAASQQKHLQQQQQHHHHQLLIQYQRSFYLQQQLRLQQQQQQLVQEREQMISSNNENDVDNNDGEDDDEIESIGNEYDQDQQAKHEQISECESEDDDDDRCIKNELINKENRKFKIKLENSTGSTPEQSSTSGCTTSSSYYCNETSFNQLKSNLTYSSPISSSSSSSSSVSSSCNSSNSNTPQTQISMKQQQSYMDSGNSTKTIVNVKKLNEKKINFACISSLID